MEKLYDINSPEAIALAVADIEKTFDRHVKLDERIFLYETHSHKLVDGTKRVTIRIDANDPQGVRLPVGIGGGLCPWFETKPDDKEFQRLMGYIQFAKLGVVYAPEVPHHWAMFDGFSNVEQLLKEMPQHWPHRFPNGFGDDDILTLNIIEKVYLDTSLLTKK